MTIRQAEDHIKPVGLPVKCSSCFAQQPGLRHIDFDAACDRGFYGDSAANDVVMDDLVICESCVGEAARQLGWMPTSEVKDKLASLEHRLEEEKVRADKAAEYADRMEEALKHRPGGEVIVKRPRGNPLLKLRNREEEEAQVG